MTEEDEEFNRIEREAAMRKAAVRTTVTKREWIALTDEEIDQGLVRTNYAMQTAGAWRDGVEWAQSQLKEKNCGM